MKIIFVLLLAIGFRSEAQYHIRVEPYAFRWYCIAFTNDNWKTKDYIKDAFDVSGMLEPVDVAFQTHLDYDCATAKIFVSKFTSLKKCLDHNNSQLNWYRKRFAYRKLHPIPVKKEPECKIINVY